MSENHIEYDAELCHEFCRRNKESLAKSKYAGCFYCCRTFNANEVVTFKKAGDGCCPHCGYDTVIPDADVPMPPPPLNGKSPVSQPAILMSMNMQWFNRSRVRPA